MPKQTGKIRLDGMFADRNTTTEHHVFMPGGWWLWCLVGLAIGLSVWLGGRHYLRAQFTGQLASAQSEHTALQSIEALLRLDGDAAIEVSRSLAHPEFMVANAAFRALNQQLDAWSRLAPAERLRRMKQVVAELDRVPSDLDQDHRILVNGLASRVYAETLSNREAGAAELLDSCRRIMSRPSPVSAGLGAQRIVAEQASSHGGRISDLESDSPVPPPLPPLQAVGAAPISPWPSAQSSAEAAAPRNHQSSTRAEAQPAIVESAAMPRMISNSGERIALSSGRATVQLTASPAAENPMRTAEATVGLSETDLPVNVSMRLSSQPHEEADKQVVRTDENLNDADDPALHGLNDLPIDQLVRLLSSVQPRVAQAASLALKGKGMSDDKLTLAMTLANGSSAERQALLQSLAERKDLDPRPWLLWMAGDGDEKVREQAVGLLNPLMDNDVRRQLRLLLNKERDERVAQTIRRVLVQ